MHTSPDNPAPAPLPSPEAPQLDDSGWLKAGGEDGVRPEDALILDIQGFEGPLDLLLALARTHKLDLAKISVLELVEQYLLFISEARRLRLELAADYLVMAAWLAFLKSKLLLPKEKSDAIDASGEELAARLAFRLRRLEAMRTAAAQLMTRKRLGLDVFARGMPEGMKTIRQRVHTAEIFDLLRAYADQRKRTVVHRAHVVKRRTVWSIKDARQRLHRLVGASAGEWLQLDFFIEQYLPSAELSRTTRAASFGASLEMARDGLIDLQQAEPFAPIYMRRRDDAAAWERIA